MALHVAAISLAILAVAIGLGCLAALLEYGITHVLPGRGVRLRLVRKR